MGRKKDKEKKKEKKQAKKEKKQQRKQAKKENKQEKKQAKKEKKQAKKEKKQQKKQAKKDKKNGTVRAKAPTTSETKAAVKKNVTKKNVNKIKKASSRQIKNAIKEKVKIQQNDAFLEANTQGKINIILTATMAALSTFAEQFVIFLISVVSILYLYFKLGNQDTSDIFPSDHTKFPYVYVEKNKDYDEQQYLTTLNIDETAGFASPLFKKIREEVMNNNSGNLDEAKMKQKIKQPQNATKSSIDPFASFFNFSSTGKKVDDINILQLVSYILLYGVISVNGFFGGLHDICKGLYGQNNNSTGINKQLMQLFGSLLTFFLITVLYFFFKMSQYDFSDMLTPFLKNNTKGFYETGFGISQITDLFSSLFSGFFALFKIIFIIAYIVFLLFSIIGIFKLTGSLSNLTSIIICFIMIITFLSNFILFGISLKDTLKSGSMDSFANELFAKIFNNIQKSFGLFSSYVGSNNDKSFIGRLLNVDSLNTNSYTSMIFFVLSLPLTIMFLPIMLVPLVGIIFGIILSIIPALVALYTGSSITYDFAFKGFLKIPSILKQYSKHYFIITLAFILNIALYIGAIKGHTISDLIQTGVSILFIILMTLFLLIHGTITNLKFGIKDKFIDDEIKKMSQNEINQIIEQDKINVQQIVTNVDDAIIMNSNSSKLTSGEMEKVRQYISRTKQNSIKEFMNTSIRSLIKQKMLTRVLPITLLVAMPGLMQFMDKIKKFKASNIKGFKF